MKSAAAAAAFLTALGTTAASAAEAQAINAHVKELYAARYADQKSGFMRLLSFGKEAKAALTEEKKVIEEKLVELPKEIAGLKAGKKRKTPSRSRKAVERELKDFRVAKIWVDVLLAEIEATRGWTEEIPADLQGKLNATVNLMFTNEPIGRALESCGRQVGVGVVVSPAAARLQKVSVIDVTGTASLKEFLDWVCAQFDLRVGAAGGKIVVAPKL